MRIGQTPMLPFAFRNMLANGSILIASKWIHWASVFDFPFGLEPGGLVVWPGLVPHLPAAKAKRSNPQAKPQIAG